MAKCSFSIPFSGPAENFVQKAQTAINSNSGKFNGDTSSGAFVISTPLGEISGVYAVENQSFFISIEDKPFLVSCSKIENTLKDYLKSSV